LFSDGRLKNFLAGAMVLFAQRCVRSERVQQRHWGGKPRVLRIRAMIPHTTERACWCQGCNNMMTSYYFIHDMKRSATPPRTALTHGNWKEQHSQGVGGPNAVRMTALYNK
jgi:hypothetical protein